MGEGECTHTHLCVCVHLCVIVSEQGGDEGWDVVKSGIYKRQTLRYTPP